MLPTPPTPRSVGAPAAIGEIGPRLRQARGAAIYRRPLAVTPLFKLDRSTATSATPGRITASAILNALFRCLLVSPLRREERVRWRRGQRQLRPDAARSSQDEPCGGSLANRFLFWTDFFLCRVTARLFHLRHPLLGTAIDFGGVQFEPPSKASVTKHDKALDPMSRLMMSRQGRGRVVKPARLPSRVYIPEAIGRSASACVASRHVIRAAALIPAGVLNCANVRLTSGAISRQQRPVCQRDLSVGLRPRHVTHLGR